MLLSAQDFEELAYEYLKKAAGDNVRHAEVFFDPQGHLERGVRVESVVTGWKNAVKKAETEGLGVTALLIPCLLRHLPVGISPFTIVVFFVVYTGLCFR